MTTPPNWILALILAMALAALYASSKMEEDELHRPRLESFTFAIAMTLSLLPWIIWLIWAINQ